MCCVSWTKQIRDQKGRIRKRWRALERMSGRVVWFAIAIEDCDKDNLQRCDPGIPTENQIQRLDSSRQLATTA